MQFDHDLISEIQNDIDRIGFSGLNNVDHLDQTEAIRSAIEEAIGRHFDCQTTCQSMWKKY